MDKLENELLLLMLNLSQLKSEDRIKTLFCDALRTSVACDSISVSDDRIELPSDVDNTFDIITTKNYYGTIVITGPSLDKKTRAAIFNSAGILAVILEKLTFENELLDKNKNLEERVNERTQKLEKLNEELERYSYTLSHDLKTPLITVRLFLDLLKADLEKNNKQGIERDLKYIDESSSQMLELLSDSLELLKSTRKTEQFENVSVSEIVSEVIRTSKGMVNGGSPKITISEDLPMAFVERSKMFLVFQNLYNNALKYSKTDEEVKVEFGYRSENGDGVFFVKDFGIGIDPKYKTKVFELFEQLEPKCEGSGVGLAIVKRIVEGYEGRIWFDSNGEGQGSTFSFSLPNSRLG